MTLQPLSYIFHVDYYQILWYFGDTYWLTSLTFGGSFNNYPDKDNMGWVFFISHTHFHRILHLSHHWFDIRPPAWTQSCYHNIILMVLPFLIGHAISLAATCWAQDNCFPNYLHLYIGNNVIHYSCCIYVFSLWSCLHRAGKMSILIIRFSCILQDWSAYDNH